MTFNKFLQTDVRKRFNRPVLYQRLLSADIKSRKELLSWWLERYPAPWGGRSARRMAEALWAEYLKVKETSSFEDQGGASVWWEDER